MRLINFVFKYLQTEINQFFMREKFTSISLTIFLVLNFFNQLLLAQSNCFEFYQLKSDNE